MKKVIIIPTVTDYSLGFTYKSHEIVRCDNSNYACSRGRQVISDKFRLIYDP